jgi:hypothetical protein
MLLLACLLLSGNLPAQTTTDNWQVAFTFDKNLQGWQCDGKHAADDASLTQAEHNGRAVALLQGATASDARLSVSRSIHLPTDRQCMLEVHWDFTCPQNDQDVTFVIQFGGGRMAGNGRWQTRALRSITSAWQQVTMAVDAVDLRFMNVHDIAADRTVTLTPDVTHVPKRVKPFDLGVNLPFWFPGVYDGTLPDDAPGSQRKAYITALQQAGVGSVRFPGGTNSHFYLLEGPQFTRKLVRMLAPHESNVNDDWPKGHDPAWPNVLETMRAAGIKIIYQLNTSFYVDDAGNIRPICDSKFTRSSGLADGLNHATDAAAALARLFERGVLHPGDVDYWEIGNEEFAKMTMQQYADIVTAFTRVLHQYDPLTPICYTGHWAIEPLLEQSSVMGQLTGKTFHYPYSNWPKPDPAIATADYASFALVDVGFTRSLDRFVSQQQQGQLPASLKRSITETGVYKYWTYDPFRMTCSFAHALAFASNWPELMSHPAMDLAVFHDLESPFFGMLMYHVQFSNVSRQWEWMPPNVAPQIVDDNLEGGAKARRKAQYPRQYVAMPTAHVMAMLSKFRGAQTQLMHQQPGHVISQAMIGLDGSRCLLFVACPGDEPVRLKMAWPVDWPMPDGGTWRMLDSDALEAVLDTEYRQNELPAPLPENKQLDVLLPPRSVHVFAWTYSH